MEGYPSERGYQSKGYREAGSVSAAGSRECGGIESVVKGVITSYDAGLRDRNCTGNVSKGDRYRAGGRSRHFWSETWGGHRQCPRVAREADWKACRVRFIDDICCFPEGGKAREVAIARCSKASGRQGEKRETTVEPSSQRSSGLAMSHLCTNASRHSHRGCKIHECFRRKRVNGGAAEGRNEIGILYLPIICKWPRKHVRCYPRLASTLHGPNSPLAPVGIAEGDGHCQVIKR